MAWRDIPARLFGRRSEMADIRKLSSVISQAEKLLGEGNIRGVADLVGRYRRSRVLVTGLGATLAAWKHTFLAEPRDVDAESTKALTEALRKTRLVEKSGRRPASAPENADNPVFGILALYALLQETAQTVAFDARRPVPPPSELEAAVGILRRQYADEIFGQLCDLATARRMPSCYVAALHGWEVDRDRIQEMRQRRETVPPEERRALDREIARLETDMQRGAERTLERMEGVRLPATYTSKLTDELEILAWLAHTPERIDDPRIDRQLLDKYGIRPGRPRAEQLTDVEAAFRELDQRLARIAGRPPCADRLFGTSDRELSSARQEPPHRTPQAEVRDPGPSLPEPAAPGRRMKR